MEPIKKATFAAISCVHSPYYNESARDQMLSSLSDNSPTHFIMLGDLFDAGAVSVHPHEFEHSLEHEYEKACKYLIDIMNVLPEETKLVWTHGNHDDNILAKDPRRSPRGLRSLLSWNKHYEFGETFRKWKQLPYSKSKSGVYKLGQVFFYHGYDASCNSDQLETLQIANIMGGYAHRLFIRGHTHRPTVGIEQCKRTLKIKLPWYYANAGTMGSLNPDYMNRKDSSGWGAAMVVGEASLSEPRRPSTSDWDAHVVQFDG